MSTQTVKSYNNGKSVGREAQGKKVILKKNITVLNVFIIPLPNA